MNLVNPYLFSKPFVSTWRTSNISSDSSNSTQIKLPLISTGSYNFTVDWGDGSSDKITTWNQAQITHNYSVAGDYTITITGNLTGWQFNNAGDKLKILSISSWGKLKLGNADSFFYGCANLDLSSVTDVLDLQGTTILYYCFKDCTTLTTIGKLNNWNTSNITDMSYMFSFAPAFNQNIGSWNVSNVTRMDGMFDYATSFNQNIGSWNVSNVESMFFMFFNARSFNQNIGSWNVVNVYDMGAMFYGASSFNQDIGNWNVGNVHGMGAMFLGAKSFNKNIGSWNVSNVEDMSSMFYGATSFNQYIGGWNVSNVEDMSKMFSGFSSFNQNIGNWNISNVGTFTGFMATKTAVDFSAVNLDAIYNGWSTRRVKNPMSINFGTAKYTSYSSAGRAILTSSPNKWSITDGGM